MRPVLFIDRDGVVLQEPPIDFQIDSIDKTSFVKGSISALSQIAASFDYYKVMVTNQDGLGTDSYPEATFFPYHNLMLRTLEGEGFVFDEMIIDRTFAADNQPTRKPGTALLQHFFNTDQFDLTRSFVIGDRWSDIQLAKNLGCKAIYLKSPLHELTPEQEQALRPVIALETDSWQEIYTFLKLGMRVVHHERNTNETKISVALNLDGSGRAEIHTGLGFFDHMLDQIARHGKIDLTIHTSGDLHIDEHHTIEDTGIALGEAFAKALIDKRGMERYGFAMPMDEAEAKVLIDFGGRNWIVWDAEFKREKVGEMPTEMFFHFFKSFSDAAKCNLNISCSGDNEHHKIEAIFKAFAKAIRMAVKRDPFSNHLPSTKGVL
ncbi:MAG: bifunctional histidinol-phosphatase/imidazoleglycerol-phosphate dehydratase HisB [Sediminibacterium sp. Gen4]|jgi:imidazoleglycerol-phosphate dehydratase / histidinol-phosphatase|uniref:bifunctional histidinol-phosphatase/imidazoleglycerol-phosphate dehydratase HisB n=1 Tax=unclassified Sediminibacterium TaxID=2635961 RepID=UPI0015C13120|nr:MULTISPECIES: bifunctional histidinol-phosphatase/imidazoleglycerol-phosphate dehydratase HisB [unclassified Sediminibacterium]MBW0160691.1 bifunctional histidinol-phosphatase/imidazoleglycerol-phosphate dehydratase HisB [Sediminibacterium sp.]MBW0165748.1 bifunctional histidinol-phosphatase/imidazoleglycerol-phosphate dehydratase HisB [Sediminibacterium sp.]NWK64715.1 bifunctional histidinol-phosphatase/imidazoleglycerol-phosphate dehydratase HisB [Sediminibacterium sp. Gen4]